MWVRATPCSCAPGTAPIPAWQWTHTPVHTWGPCLWTATSLHAFVSSINSDTRLTQAERAGGLKRKRCQDYPCLRIMSGMQSGSCELHIAWSYQCLVWLHDCTTFHISPSQLSQHLMQHVSRINLGKWLTYLPTWREIQNTTDDHFCQHISQWKHCKVLCDILQLCVLYHITNLYLCRCAVGYFIKGTLR